MRNLKHICSGVDVLPLAVAIRAHPELWDQHTMRTESYQSPHAKISDIWVRYNDWANFDGDVAKFNGPHESVWYPAIQKIPQVRNIVFPLMARLEGTRLGGVLITRIPPGGKVAPHIDPGWHAKTYQKYAIQIESAPEQAFCFEEGQFVSQPGDVYWFNNQETHWVINDSGVDRITMIVCISGD